MAELILTLDRSGQPNRWSTWQDIVCHQAKDNIAWSLGEIVFTARGGINGKTGEQSVMTVPSIVAVKTDVVLKYRTPALTNKNLFRRDLGICAYCGKFHREEKLTRDHIIPVSLGGKNIWMNCVTACKPCNNYKADYLLEDIDMDLLYLPYVPDKNEALILKNRHIKADQMDFLKQFLPSSSRAHMLQVYNA